MRTGIVLALSVCGALLPCAPAGATGHLVTAAGTSPAQIREAVGRFHDRFDAPRQVTWDDVPDELADPATLPPDFYAAQGLIARGTGGDQRVSMDDDAPTDADPDQVEFSDQEPAYASQFKPFSKERLFAPFASITTEFTFSVPGGAAGYTNGFGLVFTDVDAPGSRVVFLTPDGESLGSFDVPISTGTGSLSFLGATFDAGERVGAVRVIAGTSRIGAVDAPDRDVVALDDVIYGAPQATPPEPTVQFAAERIDGAERDGLVHVQVTRTGDLDRVSRVALTNEPGSATLGDDYASAGDSLAFPRGTDRATAVIRLVRSPDVEPEESFAVGLSPIRGAVIGEPARTTVVIAADRSDAAGGPAPAVAGPPKPVVRLGTAKRIELRRLVRKGLRARLRSDRDAFAEVTLTRGTQLVMHRTLKLAAGKRLRFRMRPRRHARRVLRRARGGLHLLVAVTDARNGTRVTAGRAVRLLLR